jgi:hypothetical protein
MSVAEARTTMMAGAPARTDGQPLATVTASVVRVVLRAASFLGERDRSRFFASFTRPGIFLNETRRSDRSTLSRYLIERAGGSALLTSTVLFGDPAAGALIHPAKELPHARRLNVPRNGWLDKGFGVS